MLLQPSLKAYVPQCPPIPPNTQECTDPSPGLLKCYIVFAESRDGSSERKSSSSPNGTNPNSTASQNDSSDSSSDISTLPDMACSGESWLVTPPPCFTAGGRSEERMEASPMENLLIEHPSMSVYSARGRNSSTGVESDVSGSSSDSVTVEKPTREVTRRSPRRPHAVAERAGLIAHVQSVKSVQKAQQRKERRQLSRNNIHRSNRVHEIQARSKHQRRKDFMLRPSGRSNDRRC